MAGTPRSRLQNRLLSRRFELLFYAEWRRALFIHYEVDLELLRTKVPFELDLFAGKAYVSLVIFMMRRLRPAVGGKFGEWIFRPISNHGFLNVRTYVWHRGEPGIYFLAEWLSNLWSVPLGRLSLGLPYRFAQLAFDHDYEENRFEGNITARRDRVGLRYSASLAATPAFLPCAPGSLDEFLLERYTCFTSTAAGCRFFRVWHGPWTQQPVSVKITDQSLFAASSQTENGASLVGASYAPGFEEVWMGRPHRTPPPPDLLSNSCTSSCSDESKRKRKSKIKEGSELSSTALTTWGCASRIAVDRA